MAKVIEPTQTLWTYAKRIDTDFPSMDSDKFHENTGIRVRTVSQDINPTANHTSYIYYNRGILSAEIGAPLTVLIRNSPDTNTKVR
jgi:hypothetical protein